VDPGFSLISIARPYLLPLMTASGQGPNDCHQRTGRQPAKLGARPRHPRRLDDSLARIGNKATSGYESAPRKPTASSAAGHRPSRSAVSPPASRPGHSQQALLAQRPPSPHRPCPLVLAWARGPSLAELQGNCNAMPRIDKLPGVGRLSTQPKPTKSCLPIQDDCGQ